MQDKRSKQLRKLFFTLALASCTLALSACEKPADKEARYLKRGNALFAQGEYDKARLEYKNAARVMPGDAEPRYRMGTVDEAEGDVRGAFANFASAELQNAHYRPALLKLAQYYLAADQTENAEKRIITVLADAPDDLEAHALNAALLLRKGDYAGTEKEARFTLAKDAANVEAISVMIGLYTAQKDPAKAEALVEEGIKKNPSELSLLILKAAVYEQAGDLGKVDEAYQAIFKLQPREVRFRDGLAQTYLKAGKPDKAEAVLRDGVTAMPDDWSMKHELIAFLDKNRGLDAAEKEIRNLMTAYPQNDALYFWLAEIYIRHDATDRAVALLEQIVAKDESSAAGLGARTSLAHIQFVKGNRTLAQKLVAAVLDKDPANQEALLIHAGLLFDEGHYQDTVSVLRTILRDHQQSVGALKLLAETFLVQGHLDLAIDTQNQLLEAEPANSEARTRLAQMVIMNGDPKRALELLAMVTKSEPNYPVGWESTARVAISIKDWPTAEAAIKVLDGLPGQHLTATFLSAQVLAYSGKIDDAVALYIQVISADPASPLAEHAVTALVEAYQSQNRLQDAVTAIRGLKSDTPYMTSLLGECLVKLGKPDEASAAFDKAIAENASFQGPYIGRAKLYAHDQKNDQALGLLKKATEVAPADIHAPMMEATILANTGRIREAIALYEDILARNPGIDAAANNLAQAIADYEYTDNAAMEKARQTAERFVGSNNPLFLDTLAWVYYRQDNIQQAQTMMERVMAAKGQLPPEVHYHYASILLKAGRPDEARTELKMAVAPGAEYSGLEDAKKLLAVIN